MCVCRIKRNIILHYIIMTATIYGIELFRYWSVVTDLSTYLLRLKRCNPWPHVANRHISIRQLLSLWRRSHYGHYGTRGPRSHHDVILIMTYRSRLRRSQPPFSLWRHSHCDVIRYWAGVRTLPSLICRDVFLWELYYLVNQYPHAQFQSVTPACLEFQGVRQSSQNCPVYCRLR